ncbi:hypothetical protein DFH08DRAFT_1044355, partial [Mycena albidolilacea]
PNNYIVNNILGNFEHYLSQMGKYVGGNPFALSNKPVLFMVDNVPDAVNPIKAALAYHQVAGSTTLSVSVSSGRFAAISALSPHQIISVVNWASSTPILILEPEMTMTYNVFAFGVNDPKD